MTRGKRKHRHTQSKANVNGYGQLNMASKQGVGMSMSCVHGKAYFLPVSLSVRPFVRSSVHSRLYKSHYLYRTGQHLACPIALIPAVLARQSQPPYLRIRVYVPCDV